MQHLVVLLALVAAAAPAMGQVIVVGNGVNLPPAGGGLGTTDPPPDPIVLNPIQAGDFLLSWNAPSDEDNNGVRGAATAYRASYSTSGTITSSNLALATRVDLTGRVPLGPGSPETLDLRTLFPHTTATYWVVMQSTDAASNVSSISNCVQVMADFTPPDPVTLNAMAASTDAPTVTLTWTPPAANDGVQIRFDYAETPDFSHAAGTDAMSMTPAHTAMFDIVDSRFYGRVVYFRAQTMDAWGNPVNSSGTAPWTMLVAPPEPPPGPENAKGGGCMGSAAGSTGMALGLLGAALALLRPA